MSTKLDEIANALRHLHRALVEIEAENFGPISGPFQLLNLVTQHEHFAWLHSLSELMVDLDELRESDEPIDSAQAGALRATIEDLVGPRAPSPAQFRARYVTLLQESPKVAMAHGDLRRVLDTLPDTGAKEAPALSSQTRTTQEVLEDHLDLAQQNDVETDIDRNFDPECVLMTSYGDFRGHAGVREAAELLANQIGPASYDYKNRRWHEELAFLEWTADTDKASVPDGADSYWVKNGRIRAMTIHYSVEEK